MRNFWNALPRWERAVFIAAAIFIVILAFAGCGNTAEDPPQIDARQRCVDEGKVALLEDHKLIACITIDEYTKLRGGYPLESSNG